MFRNILRPDSALMITMNQALFEKSVQGGNVVLVEFQAPWCGYCRRIAPAYDKVAQQMEGEMVVAKINIDDEPLIAHQEQIEVIPTLVLYRGGKVLGSIVAPESKARIEQFIEESLA